MTTTSQLPKKLLFVIFILYFYLYDLQQIVPILMKLAYIIIAVTAITYAGCKSSKNAQSSAAAAPAAPSTSDLVKAAQAKWPDITAQTIDEGKDLYNTGACTGCHGPKNIAKRSEAEWPSIVERMAHKAKITDSQKDAVLKYVLAMKMASK